MRRLWIVAFLALVACRPAGAAEPMVVRVVHGSPSCQPACGDWISATGEIQAETPAQFRKVLSSLGGRKLAVIIHSPGGRLSAALSIGRMIRARGLAVAVGETRMLQQKVDEVLGEVVPFSGVCTSACPFILAGGVDRYSGESAVVGLHQAMLIRSGKAVNSASPVTSKKRLVADSERTSALFRSMRGKLRSYLAEMGVSPEVVVEMDKATPMSMNRLSMARQKELGLVTSDSSVEQMLGLASQPLQVSDAMLTSSMEPLP
jgi:hypothetical protein